MQGVIAAFHELDSAVHAVEDLKKERYPEITVYTPTPHHEFDEVLARPESHVRRWTLIGGVLGCTFGYWIWIWITRYWPLVVGGKAIVALVPFTIFGFEVMVLVGSLATVIGMFANSRIPRLTQTVGYDARFSAGHFGVWVETPPDRAEAAADLLRRHGATEVRHER
ncbi:MAG: DUF3341 domain-containing protein [Gemmatimonadota bacterium]|nr:DUF3341 domain-containing protein [Gemmatimonadota bacterium]MDE3217619.1 DUF3341 domain-containing protein [Gemmatimonadota bacterium]